MLFESFQTKYTSIPLATFSRNHKRNAQISNFGTLMHMHKEIEILYVLDGEALLQIDAVSYTIHKGDIVVIAPYTLHGYTIFANRDFSHHCMCFDLDMLYDKQLKTAIENGNTAVEQIIHHDTVCAAYIRDIIAAHKDQTDGWELQVLGNIHLLFAAFQAGNHIKYHIHAASRSIYAKIFTFIEDNYCEDITSADAAAFLDFSAGHFCRLFRKTFGDSFQNYLCKYRIEKSKILLRNTDTPISQIAANVGFNSFSYYSKKFKEYNHINPLSYRNRH